MAALRGLREALVMYAIGVAAALLGAGIWTLVDGGDLSWRFGVLTTVAGVVLALTGGGLQINRAQSMEARVLLGAPPERETVAGGAVLTQVGVFLFVTVPLIATGLLFTG
ncbi:MAG TPA: hypothetical protein VF657_03395 [Actinoplanes sp.]|jgi:hypothetical protein